MNLNEMAGVALLMAVISPSVLAGDLDPPGAPAATAGPEPRIAINADNTPGNAAAFFRITASGSYYLAGNFFSRELTPRKHGIVIEASNVTLDLNGFTLDGHEPFVIPLQTSPTPQIIAQPTVGILVSGGQENISVRNGIVLDWNDDGLRLRGGALVETVHSRNNGGDGFYFSGNAIVRGCIAQENGGNGIYVSNGGNVSDSTCSGNGADGFQVNSGVIRGCVAENNTAWGIRGDRILVSDCSVNFNQDGISVQYNGSVLSCVLQNNFERGIRMISSNLVRGNNVANNNGIGIEATGIENVIIQNTVNTSSDPGSMTSSIAAGNSVGPFLSAADPIASTNPWANFSF